MTDPNPKRSTIPAQPQQRLMLYRLVPVAAANDPNWDKAPNQGEVVVRAYSSGDARIVAEEAEADFLDTKMAPGDGNSTRMASAFRDEKLYTVVDEPETEATAEGPRGRGIVSGAPSRNTVGPLERE